MKVLKIVGLILLAAIGILGVYGVLMDKTGLGEFLPIHWMIILGLLVLASVVFVVGLYLLRFAYRFVTKSESGPAIPPKIPE